MQQFDGKNIGPVLAISGSVLTLLGTVLNSFLLDHIGAMTVWCFSNPIMLAWAVGYFKGYWDGGLSAKALIGLYAGLTIFNTYGMFILGAV
jgi:hypothetical protein